jgi:hypothetical protein
MIDYDKPILDENNEPIKIGMLAAHCCIRVQKQHRALKKLGYKIYGSGNKVSYGTDEFETYLYWHNEKQFKENVRLLINEGVRILQYANEPDHPVTWTREVIDGMNMQDKVKLIADLHDLDSIRRGFIPIPERKMFNDADAFIFVSKPIQEIEVKLQQISKPNILLISYCNEGVIEYDKNEISNRQGIVYEGGANPPNDKLQNEIFAYRDLYKIVKTVVEMGNEVHMYCGNMSAYTSYIDTGAVLYPPTEYDKMMEGLTRYKYGLVGFNNKDGKQDQVNYTLTNKMQEYLQAGVVSLGFWAKESEKYIKKHGIGFTFHDITEIGDTTHLQKDYLSIVNNIEQKRKELVMENFIVILENLMAELLGTEKKYIPENIQEIHKFELS